jgi:hypothetical protein
VRKNQPTSMIRFRRFLWAGRRVLFQHRPLTGGIVRTRYRI